MSNLVFVLGLGANGLAILRSIKNSNWSIIGVAEDSFQVGLYSKFLDDYKIISSKDDKRLLSFLMNYKLGVSQKAAIICDSDAYVVFCSEYRQALSQKFIFNIYDSQISDAFTNKSDMSILALKAGFKIPKTHFLEDTASDSIGFNPPYILKPKNSFGISTISKNHIFNEKDALINFITKNKKKVIGKTVLQEYIDGPDSNIFQSHAYVNNRSKILALCTSRKLVQTQNNSGVGMIVQNKIHPNLIKKTINLIRKINYHGAISIEFKYSKSNKEFYFIEINPRRTLHHFLFTRSNCNLAQTEIDDLFNIHNKICLIQNSKNILWIKDDSLFSRNFLSIIVVSHFIKNLGKFETVRSHFDISDPLPFVAMFLRIFKKIINVS